MVLYFSITGLTLHSSGAFGDPHDLFGSNVLRYVLKYLELTTASFCQIIMKFD